MIINVCLVVCLLVNFIELADLTEDHYYVENSSRMVLILALIILAPLTFLLHGIGLPDTLTAGVAGFEVFEIKEAIDWYVLFYCSGFGLCAGFFMSLLSEYFTSMNCPPS
jgi:Na+/H+-translocating membrane pyrophosphatase